MRAFLAVDLPRPAVPGMSARDEAPPHLTLAFLGEIAEERLAPLVEGLRPRLGAFAPFEAVLEGVGAFPDARRPKVVWVGFSRGGPELQALAEAIRSGLAALGLPVEARPFVPHLTLFRVRGPGEARRARALLASAPTGALGRTEIGEVLLKASTLAPGGAVHRIVARFPLGRPPG